MKHLHTLERDRGAGEAPRDGPWALDQLDGEAREEGETEVQVLQVLTCY